MENRETKPLLCPFCRAPQRRYIPAGAVQVKCQYCGGVFLVPPQIGGEIPQCPNHSDRLAIGFCNDCRESYCSECLHIYYLETNGVSVTLYLCPTCLRRRHIKKANGLIFVGLAWLLFALFFSTVLFMPSILFAAMAVALMIYGVWRRSETFEESTIEQIREDEKKRRAELVDMEGVDAEETYDKLLTQYVNRWGAQTGIELLESEIMAYIRHGETFSEAVKKIYQRQRTLS